ncbi:hypothetical protein pEaSNUABM37_00242 [Erwinia phage pEa_SNUABM_37]|nr:hypothetical protein pEaSNUABM37_00242 [Erwinia phage pEa_SNUABM_37]QXO10710.1 hypothetical protein pEaSNUABM48_00242 [Erwinia phage pEa_SNUABM_48]
MFVIPVGEHLAAISYNAPWMNNQPVNHGQAYMILCAIHEELANEIFSWAKIDNSLQETIAKVYHGFTALVEAEPRIWKWNGREWGIQHTPTTQQFPVEIRPGQGLPRNPVVGTAYRVHGGVRYDDCFQFFIDNTVETIRWLLRKELNKYLGTSRDYEWYFEYNANGIVYNKQGKATPPEMINHAPQTESEAITEEILYMPKVDMPGMTMIVDLSRSETRGGKDLTTGEVRPDLFGALMNALPNMLNELYQRTSVDGSNRADVRVLFTNPMFLREVTEYIADYTRNWPIRFVVETEQVMPKQTQQVHILEKIDRAFQNRSMQVVNQQQDELVSALSAIRDRMARRNNVTELDIREIESLAPDILKETVLNDDLYVSVNNRDHWYKFADKNPSELQQPVIGLCLLLSNRIDLLSGVTSTTRGPIPMFEPRNDSTLIGAIPLHCN